MPLAFNAPQTVTTAVADEGLVTGFQLREADHNTGEPLASPTITIYWIKRDKITKAVKDRGAYTFPAMAFAVEKPDGTKSYRGNIKARLYQELVTAGVFPAGVVS